jgi:electron transfer flavoprotein beta subunit
MERGALLMKIIVPVQLVPDLVEEIEINEEGNGFDLDYMAWILNEFDDHAIEQAILIKEKVGCEVIVIGPDWDEIDDALYAAAAKGADRLIKVAADFEEEGINNHALARIFKPIIAEEKPDLILTGVSNHNGMDGVLGALLAESLDMPYIGYVSGVTVADGKAAVLKDYPGGIKASLESAFPVVLGISSSETPPRYVPISKVRQAMKTSEIDEMEGEIDLDGALPVASMYEPETTGKAEMIEGDIDDVIDRIVAIIKEQGLV